MDNNVMIFYLFAQPVKNDIRTYENNQKIAIDQGDDYNWFSTRLSLFRGK